MPGVEVVLATLEPPWRDNQPFRSCIPVGRYRIQLAVSPRFGRNIPHLLDVPGRTDILIHPMNRPADTHGCIGVGLRASEPGRPPEIQVSRVAVDAVIGGIRAAEQRGETVWITIRDTVAILPSAA